MSKSPRRIDVHHHYIPPEYRLLLREKGIRPGGIPLPRWAAPMASKVMAANGVETAVVMRRATLATAAVATHDQLPQMTAEFVARV